MNFKSS